MEHTDNERVSKFNFNEEEVKYNPVMGTLKIPNVKTLHYCPSCDYQEFLSENKIDGWICSECGDCMEVYKLKFSKPKKKKVNEFLTKEEMEI